MVRRFAHFSPVGNPVCLRSRARQPAIAFGFAAIPLAWPWPTALYPVLGLAPFVVRQFIAAFAAGPPVSPLILGEAELQG
jgi:hypothetical protein